MIYFEQRGINILYTCQCPTFLIFICRLRVRRLWFASSDKERRFLSLCSVFLGFVLSSPWDDCLIIDKKNGLGLGERSPSVFLWKLRRNRWRANLVSSKSDQNAMSLYTIDRLSSEWLMRSKKSFNWRILNSGIQRVI